MRAVPWLAMAILTACEPIEPSGSPFAPVASAPIAPPTAPAPAAEPAGGFDFDADAPPEVVAPAEATLEPVEVAAGLGLGPVAVAPTPAPAPAVEPAPAQAPAPVGWSPGIPLEGSWGVRLVSTVPDAQPPRAILGLPGGQEVVVSPGTLLPDAGVVVLAVGRDAVQIAEITPAGDHARVETRVIEPMFRQAASPR